MKPAVRIGLEVCLDGQLADWPGYRLGLLLNQASVDCEWHYACDHLAARFPRRLTTLFAPQHGLWCEQQANMIESPHGRYEPLGLPVYSLYSQTREPTDAMLQGIDCLVVDLQDVGTRVYTFIWTVAKCLSACARRGLPVVILDRPNPLGGEIVEGPLLQPGYESFVGLAPIPMRHGLTIAELARYLNDELRIGADLQVVPMSGWRRSMLFPDTGRSWTAPSPNMPRFESALFYPGQVLLEGTNLSEGRGTTIPFELVGAPYVDPHRLLQTLNELPHPGMVCRPVRFVPTFDKWRGESCGGVSWHASSPVAVRSFSATLSVLTAVHRCWPAEFSWLAPPYEYEREKMPIDILYGGPALRTALAENKLDPHSLEFLAAEDQNCWREKTARCRMYD